MTTGEGFWRRLDQLVGDSKVVIDRPAGTAHPKYPDFVFPYDYGYLENTRSPDGAGIDVYVGSDSARAVTGVVCTVDVAKRDSEIKLLLGCTPGESRRVLTTHNSKFQSAILIERHL